MALTSASPEANRVRVTTRALPALLGLIGVLGMLGLIAQSGPTVDPGSPEAAPPALLVQTD